MKDRKELKMSNRYLNIKICPYINVLYKTPLSVII